jgi:hypothetical protein
MFIPSNVPLTTTPFKEGINDHDIQHSLLSAVEMLL